MKEWIEISEYDEMPMNGRPQNCAFLFEATKPNRAGGLILKAHVEFSRHFGSRVCTHFYPLPSIPE